MAPALAAGLAPALTPALALAIAVVVGSGWLWLPVYCLLQRAEAAGGACGAEPGSPARGPSRVPSFEDRRARATRGMTATENHASAHDTSCNGGGQPGVRKLTATGRLKRNEARCLCRRPLKCSVSAVTRQRLRAAGCSGRRRQSTSISCHFSLPRGPASSVAVVRDVSPMSVFKLVVT